MEGSHLFALLNPGGNFFGGARQCMSLYVSPVMNWHVLSDQPQDEQLQLMGWIESGRKHSVMIDLHRVRAEVPSETGETDELMKDISVRFVVKTLKQSRRPIFNLVGL